MSVLGPAEEEWIGRGISDNLIVKLIRPVGRGCNQICHVSFSRKQLNTCTFQNWQSGHTTTQSGGSLQNLILIM